MGVVLRIVAATVFGGIVGSGAMYLDPPSVNEDGVPDVVSQLHWLIGRDLGWWPRAEARRPAAYAARRSVELEFLRVTGSREAPSCYDSERIGPEPPTPTFAFEAARRWWEDRIADCAEWNRRARENAERWERERADHRARLRVMRDPG